MIKVQDSRFFQYFPLLVLKRINFMEMFIYFYHLQLNHLLPLDHCLHLIPQTQNQILNPESLVLPEIILMLFLIVKVGNVNLLSECFVCNFVDKVGPYDVENK